ncbi:hypothetical protein [Luteolibacter rhizosphaerae]|uniref:hypothetical protein n=1 Tax=Luteolibacter rhizosphaerae TaxID=2989719 RepID=UPI0022236099|nr:hypothetical protein [Luteolibacter rhizosphaerae]
MVAGLLVRLQAIRRDVERWENYQQECRSRGEDLGIEAWLPPVVADRENFAAHPWIKAMIASEKSPEAKVVWDWKYWAYDALDGHEEPDNGRSWFEDKPEKAAMVMERGATLAADLAAIREAAGRPACRLPLALDRDRDRLSEVLDWLIDMTGIISLRAEAALALNEEATAMDSIETLLQIGDHLQSQHFLLSVLVGKRVKAAAVSLIEIGLARGSFSSASRLRLRSSLLNPPAGEDIGTIVRLERGMILEQMGKLLEQRAPGERFGEGFMQPPARRTAYSKYTFCKGLDSVLLKPATRETWESFDQILEEAVNDLPPGDLTAGWLLLFETIYPPFYQHADRVEDIRKKLAE